jgi:hypothetical protein
VVFLAPIMHAREHHNFDFWRSFLVGVPGEVGPVIGSDRVFPDYEYNETALAFPQGSIPPKSILFLLPRRNVVY